MRTSRVDAMRIDVQIATDDESPAEQYLARWAALALSINNHEHHEMTVRVVGLEEGRRLNERWRCGKGATNVLAFPVDGLEVHPQLLGDIVICASVANLEAQEGGQMNRAHWAHLVIHGTLHLLGYDHLNETDATKMEALECILLNELGYPDPYR